jgi:hypothetical protein
MPKCNVCGEEKDSLALNTIEQGGQLIVQCMACNVNEWADDAGFAMNAEREFVATQKAFFKSVDKYRKMFGA